MSSHQSRNVAVIGAGVAGAACARALARSGCALQVFDKARGPGGRLATRRMEWVDRAGQAHTTRRDHGAVGMTARSDAFRAFVGDAVQAACLAAWAPLLGPHRQDWARHASLAPMQPCSTLLGVADDGESPDAAAPAEACWWDAGQGLGVCGDFLGGTGVEGAWLSAQALAAAMRLSAPAAADAATGCAA